MSTWLGIDGSSHAKLHMTSDSKTAAQLSGDPISTTVFHTDLPYVFAREQFEITSYTTWAGGRKFALPTALQTFKQNNPDLAYLVLLTDSSGNSFIHDPCLMNVGGRWVTGNSSVGVRTSNVGLCINGADYQVAYTSSDAQLSAMTANDFDTTNSDFSFTYYTWDDSDTHVTVFRTPYRRTDNSAYYNCFPVWYNPAGSRLDRSPYYYFLNKNVPKDLLSVNNDVVKIKFIFLNVIHSETQFNRQSGFNYDFIRLDPTNFIVNDLNLNTYWPIISHGFNTSGTTITKYNSSGTLASARASGTNMTQTKVSTSGVLSGGNSCVVELMPEVTGSIGWEFDLENQTIDRNGVNIFSSSWISRALRVSGTKEITFDQSTTITDQNRTDAISSSQSGNLGSVNSDTLYLASIVADDTVGDKRLQSTTLFSPGDNLIAVYTWNVMGVGWWWTTNFSYYLNISSSGVCTMYRQIIRPYSSPKFYNVGSLNIDLPNITIRLIALTTG